MNYQVVRHALLLLLLSLTMAASAEMAADSKKVDEVEKYFADVMDAQSVLATIDSRLFRSYRGKDRDAWDREYRNKRKKFSEHLAKLPSKGLSPRDAKAVAAMRTQFASFMENITAPFSPQNHCADAHRQALDYAAMRKSLVACFNEIGGAMQFEGGTITRQTALDLLHELPEAERRKAVFTALAPLWKSLNGNDEPTSPYRRMIAMASADAAKNGSEIDRAARDAGVETAAVERWLEQMLDAWRESTSDQAVEPWDFSFQGAEADRLLAARIPHEALVPINQRFYQDLGADLQQLGALYDLDPHPGKAALAYTDFVIHGRMAKGTWQPTIARVSGPYTHGGLFVLNELVHENGHVTNITAIRNRSAYVDWPSSLFAEAFADVPGWSTYEPAWQRKYLGQDTPEAISLRALYSVVILDVAWSLFEVRMLRAPATDPNVLWTEITHHYLHIIPHPELSWWALRVQLVDAPGYMVNYGFGAALTADMRQRIREQLGPFDTGDARWYKWLGDHLLQYGSERDTRTLLQDFLGRPTSPDALLGQIRRLAPKSE
jgi:hypothetical protein